MAIFGQLPHLFESAVGGLLFVLVWCNWTMPDSVYGQPGTKAIFEMGPEWHWELHCKPPDGRKRPIDVSAMALLELFPNVGQVTKWKSDTYWICDNESIFENKNKMGGGGGWIMCSVHIWRTSEDSNNLDVCHGLTFYWFKSLLLDWCE